MIYVRAAKPQKSKKSYLHKGTLRREESFLARELRASSFILPVCSFIRRVRVSRSHARVPFTRQTGLRFLRASTSRRMLIFAIYTWEPNLHHYPCGWADYASKLSLARASYTKLFLAFLARWHGHYITLKYSRKIMRFGNYLMSILNRALFKSDYFVVPFSF